MNIELKYTETLKSALAKESYDKKVWCKTFKKDDSGQNRRQSGRGNTCRKS